MPPKRLAHRGMTTLATALLGFVALELLGNAAADFIDPGLREPEYGRKLSLLKTQIRQSPHRPLLLLLGSSRTAYGLCPEFLFGAESPNSPLVYNFGILGGGPVYELLYFRRLLDAGIRPEWVVVEVHPALLKSAPELMAAHLPPLGRCDLRDLCLLHNYLDNPRSTWCQWLRYRAAACYRFRGELMRRVAPQWLPDPVQPDTAALDKTTPSGWVPGPWPRPEDVVRQARANLVRHFYSPGYQDFAVSERPDRALREVLALCRQEKIDAALLLMPESEELRDSAVTAAQHTIGRYLAELGREHGADLFDASHWCKDAEFADGQHLLADAATRLSATLGKRVLGDWVASRSRQPLDVPAVAGGRRPAIRR